MAYCKNCGSFVDDGAAVCSCCGTAQQTAVTPTSSSNDNNGFLFGLLGCCIPLVGLILFLIWKDEKPKTAKGAGIGALVGVISSVLLVVLFYAIIFGLAASMGALDLAYIPVLLG